MRINPYLTLKLQIEFLQTLQQKLQEIQLLLSFHQRKSHHDFLKLKHHCLQFLYLHFQHVHFFQVFHIQLMAGKVFLFLQNLLPNKKIMLSLHPI